MKDPPPQGFMVRTRGDNSVYDEGGEDTEDIDGYFTLSHLDSLKTAPVHIDLMMGGTVSSEINENDKDFIHIDTTGYSSDNGQKSPESLDSGVILSDRADFDAKWPPDGKERSQHSSPNAKVRVHETKGSFEIEGVLFKDLDQLKPRSSESSVTQESDEISDGLLTMSSKPEYQIFEIDAFSAHSHGCLPPDDCNAEESISKTESILCNNNETTMTNSNVVNQIQSDSNPNLTQMVIDSNMSVKMTDEESSDSLVTNLIGSNISNSTCDLNSSISMTQTTMNSNIDETTNDSTPQSLNKSDGVDFFRQVSVDSVGSDDSDQRSNHSRSTEKDFSDSMNSDDHDINSEDHYINSEDHYINSTQSLSHRNSSSSVNQISVNDSSIFEEESNTNVDFQTSTQKIVSANRTTVTFPDDSVTQSRDVLDKNRSVNGLSEEYGSDAESFCDSPTQEMYESPLEEQSHLHSQNSAINSSVNHSATQVQEDHDHSISRVTTVSHMTSDSHMTIDEVECSCDHNHQFEQNDADCQTFDDQDLNENGDMQYYDCFVSQPSHRSGGLHTISEEGDDIFLPDGHFEYDPENNYFCTCEECMKNLRIETISTSDKSTMCPEEPPYVLMCEICEGLLENQLQKTEKDGKKREKEFEKEIRQLKKDNEEQQKIITQNISLSPEARIEATMQHEITRLTSENLDLRETIEKSSDQMRKMRKMLKVYAKRLKDGEAAEIAAELEQDESKTSVDNVASIKHRERMYMGMLEYKKEDENVLIKNLFMDLKPKVAAGLLPGLPAYVLFMCVRHTDYINDDEKVRSLLTNSINSVRKCVKKHHGDLDRVTLWLANTCRLLHTLKQYSGEKAFQADNSTRQNEHCLRNFDLSEYRQVFSDLAVWIYQTLIKLMGETIQPMIVAAVLEHEAIAGLTASKPSGMRGRSSSTATDPDDVKELSLDSLMKAMNKYSQVLTQHAVDPELVKQIFRQLYYFICAGALNNLLLRKDMCNWSKGMQIRYNLSHLEQWLRDNKLHEVGAQVTMEPIIQASQLLQARKTVADVDSICEMCSKLTTAQIVKILNLYTPVDEFEERVPIPFIREIQKKLKGRPQETDNTLLMDTKFSYPVTFPFNPSSIAMETVEVPQSLHLGFLNRV
ncbi:uncharacterized protein LOC117315603 isoform X3 [Pecten maximus]|uniref:uncharacterized protein LOC117315603 isoform X3 n=1 Tax=Pecten maximus TaxID=6579 RepID=UPI0014589041|nr:uncharacterized protein LOC117315603 isoform X3 [Pecten maximus]